MIINERLMQQQSHYFDTHSTVQLLQSAGLSIQAAEAINHSIAVVRNRDLDMITTKPDFFALREAIAEHRQEATAHFFELKDALSEHKQETATKFAKIESDITIIKADITIMKSDITLLKEDVATIKATMATKADLESLKKDIQIEFNDKLEKNKIDTIKWMVALFIAQMTTVVGLFVTIFLKLHT